MIQIPAQSVMRVLMAKFKKRINMVFKNKHLGMQLSSGQMGAFASGVAVGIAHLMSEMLKEPDDVRHSEQVDDANLNIYLSAVDTPEFQAQGVTRLETFQIVFRGKVLYEFEYD